MITRRVVAYACIAGIPFLSSSSSSNKPHDTNVSRGSSLFWANLKSTFHHLILEPSRAIRLSKSNIKSEINSSLHFQYSLLY